MAIVSSFLGKILLLERHLSYRTVQKALYSRRFHGHTICQFTNNATDKIDCRPGHDDLSSNKRPIVKDQKGNELIEDEVGDLSVNTSPKACYKMVKRLIDLEKVDKAHNLLYLMLEKNLKPKSNVFNALVVAYAKAGKCQKALSMLNEMRNRKFRPHRTTYNILMSSFTKQGKPLEALDLLDKMQQDGWAPDEVTRSILVYGLCRGGHAKQVVSLFQERVEKSAIISTPVCNAVLESFFKSGNVEAAESLGNSIMAGLCSPNVFTYATLIRGRCRQGKVDEAWDLLRKMKDKGCKPNLACYGSLIPRLCSLNRHQDAFHLFMEMISQGIDAQGLYCGFLLSQLNSKGMVTEAVTVCKYMADRRLFVKDTDILFLLEGFSKADKLGEANDFLQYMIGKGAIASIDRFQAALKALQRREQRKLHSSSLSTERHTGPKDV